MEYNIVYFLAVWYIMEDKEETKLPKIKYYQTIKTHRLYKTTKKRVEEGIQAEIPDLKSEFSGGIAVTLIVANLIEELIQNNSKYKIDKKALTSCIMTDIFTLTAEAQSRVAEDIDFLHEIKQIKRYSRLAAACSRLSAFFW
jgi:hypothetical protein